MNVYGNPLGGKLAGTSGAGRAPMADPKTKRLTPPSGGWKPNPNTVARKSKFVAVLGLAVLGSGCALRIVLVASNPLTVRVSELDFAVAPGPWKTAVKIWVH